MNLEEIATKYEHPIIGVIGATSPLPEYDSQEARKLGYELRKLVDKRGSIFSGGVCGVGLDVYEGIIDYCIDNEADDKFFVLVPDSIPNPPEEYFDLANHTPKGVLNIEKLGIDMEERRTYIGVLADLLIVINGSEGTIDEALKGLLLGKPLLCLQNSGGAADVMSRLKKGEIKKPNLDIDLNLIVTFDSAEDIIKYLSNTNLYNVNKNGE